jgi:hypothetical protein
MLPVTAAAVVAAAVVGDFGDDALVNGLSITLS